jgi:3-isopropylmalate dehydrogenase
MPLANDAFHIAVIGGDGIGPEVTAPALEMLRKVETLTPGLKFRFSEAPAGAITYKETGTALPESTTRLCEEADAILLGACGMPTSAIPTAPRSRRRWNCASSSISMRACGPAAHSGRAEPDRRRRQARHRSRRRSANRPKACSPPWARAWSRTRTRGDPGDHAQALRERLFDFSFRLAQRAQGARRQGRPHCVDKANIFRAFAFFRRFSTSAPRFPGAQPITSMSTPARPAGARPWDFDVLVTENMFGDILSDLTAGTDRRHGHGALRRHRRQARRVPALPRHRARHHGQGHANPTAMILSAALMLDWLADKFDHHPAAPAGERIERAVDRAYAAGLKPCEFGGPRRHDAVAKP